MRWLMERLLGIWRLLTRPARYLSLGLLSVGGFAGGILFWGGFNTALEATNTESFCISCHEMRDNVFEELKTTVHYTNRSGVRATCPDCHVPHNWTDKIGRKMEASKEVWGHLFGTIDTREKFLDKRGEMAAREWRRLKTNDSLECRNCHSFVSMDFTEQGTRAGRMVSVTVATSPAKTERSRLSPQSATTIACGSIGVHLSHRIANHYKRSPKERVRLHRTRTPIRMLPFDDLEDSRLQRHRAIASGIGSQRASREHG
jgi:cytochrome c-type protein NapC